MLRTRLINDAKGVSKIDCFPYKNETFYKTHILLVRLRVLSLKALAEGGAFSLIERKGPHGNRKTTA